MSFWKKIFAGGGSTPDPQPFMEHPSGDFDNVVVAMEDAVKRLRKLPKWDQWITFGAQGEGDKPESYEFADVRMMGDKLDVGERPMDVPRIIQAARTGATSLVAQGAHYSVAAASPREVAQILDAIFRQHFGIRPFPDEGDDYAVGAEW
jgi:hypothetical protein